MTEEPKELPEASIYRTSNFETSNHDKGIQTSTLPNNITKDVNSRVRPSNKGDIVKEAKHSRKPSSKPIDPSKKKIHKYPHLVNKVATKEGVEVQLGKGANVGGQEESDVPSPDPKSKPCMDTPLKGNEWLVLKGNSGVENLVIA